MKSEMTKLCYLTSRVNGGLRAGCASGSSSEADTELWHAFNPHTHFRGWRKLLHRPSRCASGDSGGKLDITLYAA